MTRLFAAALLLVALAATSPSAKPAAQDVAAPSRPDAIRTVFLIVMENQDWGHIKGNPSAPYINRTLLPHASHAENYRGEAHPSLPNYLVLEAGTTFGIEDNDDPAEHHLSTKRHLATLLTNAGLRWKSYQEDISGRECPLEAVKRYVPRHNPFVYFDDVTDENDPESRACIQQMRPYSELARDLAANTVAAYNFITPNLCHDMHDTDGCASRDPIRNGDRWLEAEVPKILASRAYREAGALLITWDEDEGEASDEPIGLIVLSPFAKGGGYSNAILYTHSSTLRTLQEIFGLTPLLRDAAKATSLRDLFRVYP